MAVPSVQDIQEQIRQQQLMGEAAPSQQQPFHPVVAGKTGGSYAPFVPQMPLQLSSLRNNERAGEIPVSIGKFSLLAISFSLMLLGAFTFLGGFLLGIWVAGPKISQSVSSYLPAPQTIPYYPTAQPYPQGMGSPQLSGFEQNLGRQVGTATESAIKDIQIHNVPTILSPVIKAAQSEIGKQAGQKTEDFLKQQLGAHPSYPQQQISQPPIYPGENHTLQTPRGNQLPVVTPQSGVLSSPMGASLSVAPPEKDEGYTVQLGIYASHENANALMNHLQALSYPSQVIEGKAPDGSKVYHVYSGFYKDYVTALNAASYLTSQNIPGAVIVRIGPQHKSSL